MPEPAATDIADAHLARSASAGDGRAFEELVRRHYAACLDFAARMLRDEFEARDAAQDTFMRAFIAMPRFDAARPFRPWLFRILLNRCRTRLVERAVRERRTCPTEEADRLLVGSEEGTDNLDAVHRAVEGLSPRLREAFLLKYVEEMGYREMGNVLGASESALKMRVKRASDLLRPLLRKVFDA